MKQQRKTPRLPKENRKTRQNAISEYRKSIPHSCEIGALLSLPIAWNFHRMCTEETCMWRCTFQKLQKHMDRLKSFEGKTFSQILNEDDSNHCWKDAEKLHKDFQKELDKHNIDSESLWQLNISSKVRLFGVRHHNIFCIMWLDENHSIYHVKKKHT